MVKKTKKTKKPFLSFGPPVLLGKKKTKRIPKTNPSGPSILQSPGGKKQKKKTNQTTNPRKTPSTFIRPSRTQ
jgi:hypothetical protein